MKTIVVVALLMLAAPIAHAQARGGELPAGAGRDTLQARCLGCHGSDLIVSQRLSETGWGRELDKMIRWGARVPDPERAPLVAYLTRHFGAGAATAPVPDADGEAIFTRACLSCHGRDLTEQQRLSSTGWTREVEKMMRWGARVSDAEKAVLVAYLAARHGAP